MIGRVQRSSNFHFKFANIHQDIGATHAADYNVNHKVIADISVNKTYSLSPIACWIALV